jgi:hypothetical protein
MGKISAEIERLYGDVDLSGLTSLTIGGNITGEEIISTSTVQSSSTSTGALRTAGGIGCLRNLNVGGNINCTTGAITGSSVSGDNVIASTLLNSSATTQSTSTSTGAITTNGGVGIAKDVHIGGELFVSSQPYGFAYSTSAGTQGIGATVLTLINGYGTNDVNGGMTYSSGVFTVPTTGIYAISGNCRCSITASVQNILIEFNTASSRLARTEFGSGARAINNVIEMSLSWIGELTASDTVQMDIYSQSAGATVDFNEGFTFLRLTKLY